MRFLTVLTCAGLALAAVLWALVQPDGTGAAATLPPPPDLQGSADCDGDVDAVDGLGMLRFAARLPVHQHEPCLPVDAPFADGFSIRHVADIDCDNDVDRSDAHRLLQYVAGLLGPPPPPSVAGAKPSPSPFLPPPWSCPPIGWDYDTD